jgi:hypothetical protein
MVFVYFSARIFYGPFCNNRSWRTFHIFCVVVLSGSADIVTQLLGLCWIAFWGLYLFQLLRHMRVVVFLLSSAFVYEASDQLISVALEGPGA